MTTYHISSVKSHEEIMEMDHQQMKAEDVKRRTMMHFDAAIIANRMIDEAREREAAKK